MSFFDDEAEVIILWIIAVIFLIFAIVQTTKVGEEQNKKKQDVCSPLSTLQQLFTQNCNQKQEDDEQFSQIQSQLKSLEDSLAAITKEIAQNKK